MTLDQSLATLYCFIMKLIATASLIALALSVNVSSSWAEPKFELKQSSNLVAKGQIVTHQGPVIYKRKKTKISDLEVPMTQGSKVAAPPGASGSGPWAVRSVLRSSADGLSFSGSETVMDQAGVPNLLITSKGDVYAYYQDWANGNVIGVAIQKSGSKVWKRYKIHVDGFNIAPGGANGVDPSAVELPSGQIRIFWMQGATNIYSATSKKGSENGIIFKFDGKKALSGFSGRIFDPTVVKTKAGWVMWVDSEGTPIYATSKDGKAFTAQSGNPLFSNPKTFPWAATRTPGGEIRVIATIQGPGGADGFIFKSTDGGKSFQEVTRGTIPSTAGGDASIAYNPKTKQWLQIIGERMN